MTANFLSAVHADPALPSVGEIITGEMCTMRAEIDGLEAQGKATVERRVLPD